jgi:dihydroorotase
MDDLLIKNGVVLDPSQSWQGRADIAFHAGRVAALAPSLDSPARQVVDAAGALVVTGLIDLHTHVYWGGTSIGVDPDEVAARSGCATMVDAGTAGAGNMAGFHRHIIEPARVRVLAYLNVSFAGIFAFSRDVMVGECSDVRLLDARACLRAAEQHADVVVGIKVRVGRIAGGGSGIGPLDVALEVASELGLPVMAHLDHPPPSRREVVERLRPGDVLTHCYRPFPNPPLRQGKEIYDEIRCARDRGVFMDIGHGMGSFGFKTARGMLEQGFYPDTISSDVHSLCVDGPAYDLLVTMSKLLSLGMPLEEVIRASTFQPARALRRDELGTLKPGAVGDATLLDIEEGVFMFEDVLGEKIEGNRRFVLRGRVLGGRM